MNRDPFSGPFGIFNFAGCGQANADMRFNVYNASQGNSPSLNSYQSGLQAQNAMPCGMNPSGERQRPRFRSIDPTQKLSNKAARLLILNHFLRAA